MRTSGPRSVLVLGGGPDSEREVSLRSARAITEALRSAGFEAVNRTIDRVTAEELAGIPGEVIFPALHGGWGEGGPLQDILRRDGRAFVGSGPQGARHAMDKIATKFTARSIGVPTPTAYILDTRDPACPLPFPVVVKPVHEGSTVGLHVCRDDGDWAKALLAIGDDRARGNGRGYMIEACISRRDGQKARELTVGLLDNEPLPVIEITPAQDLYDYEAKYNRDDTRYAASPALPPGVAETVQRQTAELAGAMGIRHIARADFMLDDDGQAWFLEINTLPGFTDHSLVPMACRHINLPMADLCARLVGMAVRDCARSTASPPRKACPHSGIAAAASR